MRTYIRFERVDINDKSMPYDIFIKKGDSLCMEKSATDPHRLKISGIGAGRMNLLIDHAMLPKDHGLSEYFEEH